MQEQLSSWQTCHDSVLRYLAEQQCAGHAQGSYDVSNISSLTSQLLQDKGNIQAIATSLHEADGATALLFTELRELHTCDRNLGQSTAVPDQNYISEQRLLYQQNHQQLKAVRTLQTAANKSRSAAAAVICRLVGFRGQQRFGILRAVLLSWRLYAVKKVLVANSKRLCDADDWVARFQERSIAQAASLVQRTVLKHQLWLQRAVFTGWNKQLWIAVRFPLPELCTKTFSGTAHRNSFRTIHHSHS